MLASFSFGYFKQFCIQHWASVIPVIFIVPHTRKCNDKLLGQTMTNTRQKYSKLQGERVRVHLYHTEVE